VHEKTNLKTTTAELLSTFCDNLMRNPKVEELELDNMLEKVVPLFGYISEKVFLIKINYYFFKKKTKSFFEIIC